MAVIYSSRRVRSRRRGLHHAGRGWPARQATSGAAGRALPGRTMEVIYYRLRARSGRRMATAAIPAAHVIRWASGAAGGIGGRQYLYYRNRRAILSHPRGSGAGGASLHSRTRLAVVASFSHEKKASLPESARGRRAMQFLLRFRDAGNAVAFRMKDTDFFQEMSFRSHRTGSTSCIHA